tara:strand:+ start:99 stop:368 length:270 start_codon:yes stop_codon:yes gene_type:complete
VRRDGATVGEGGNGGGYRAELRRGVPEELSGSDEEIRQRPKEKVWLRIRCGRGREGGAGVREAVCRELHERRDGPVRFLDTVSVLNRFF